MPLVRTSSLAAALLVACSAFADVPPRFTPQDSAILLVDHQEMTVSWVHSIPRETLVGNVRMLARLGSELHIPLVITTTMENTQVGTTIQDIRDLAPGAYASRIRRGGTLSAFLDPAFAKSVQSTGRHNLIIAGLTTDICLMHTVEDALRAGYRVQVVADGSGSTSALADQITWDRMRAIGAVVTDGNQVLSELYPDFGSADGQKAMQINLQEIISKLPKP